MTRRPAHIISAVGASPGSFWDCGADFLRHPIRKHQEAKQVRNANGTWWSFWEATWTPKGKSMENEGFGPFVYALLGSRSWIEG